MRPILFALPFGVPIYGYGTMLCLAVVVGRLLAIRWARRAGLDGPLVSRCIAWSLVTAMVGARLLYVATNPSQFGRFVDTLAWWKGGVVAYGGFLGGFLASAVFCRIHRLRLLAWADCAVPALCLGLMITRVGCLLGGCDFGRPWDGPWAVQFPAGSPAFQEQVREGRLSVDAPESLPVHPTQVYESLVGLVLFLMTIAVRRRQKAEGQVFLAVVVGYALLRGALEVLRGDADRGGLGPLSTSQWIALATFLCGATLLWVQSRRSRRLMQTS
jgi:phosphatidylglycerol:prolipoprotein diacylglycerol transferase